VLSIVSILLVVLISCYCCSIDLYRRFLLARSLAFSYSLDKRSVTRHDSIVLARATGGRVGANYLLLRLLRIRAEELLRQTRALQHHGHRQFHHARDRCHQLLPRCDRANSFRSTGEDHVATLQRDGRRDVLDQLLDSARTSERISERASHAIKQVDVDGSCA